MQKITSDKVLIERNINEYYPMCKNIRNLFPNLKIDNDLKRIAFVWLHRYLDAYDSQDVLRISANDFFLEPQKTVKKVAEFFEITPVENFEYLDFYVKKDFNVTNEILSEIEPKNKINYDFKSGYINSDNLHDIEEWLDQEILNKIKSNEIFPILRDENNNLIYYFLPGITIKM